MTHQRKVILIHRRFQLRFAFFVVSWIAVMSIIFPWVIYSLVESLGQIISKHLGQSDNAVVIAMRTAQSDVYLWLFVASIFIIGASFVWSIYFSHKIAGPVYRVQSALTRWSKGNVELNVKLRQYDHFTELADAYNDAAKNHANLIARVNNARERLEAIAGELDDRHKTQLKEISGDLKWPSGSGRS